MQSVYHQTDMVTLMISMYKDILLTEADYRSILSKCSPYSSYICIWKSMWEESFWDFSLLCKSKVVGYFAHIRNKFFGVIGFHQKSKIYDFLSILDLCLVFFHPFLAHLRQFEHKNSEISKKKVKISKLAFFDYFWLQVATMGSGVSGIDTSNI